MLTDSLRRTLEFIQEFIEKQGYAPKLPEIAQGIGIKSTGVVHRYVHALEESGYIAIEKRRHRGIRLLHSPAQDNQSSAPIRAIPLLGEIAAGQPIEAIPDQQFIELSYVFQGKNIYALRVKGDSMIEAGILDGDWVICEQANQAQDGQIVVALVDNQEATLKRIKQHANGTVALIPENHSMEAMVYPAERVTIQGILIGQLRSYR
jgi:repressor LexA